MTREDLNKANEIVKEINRINEVIKVASENEEIHLMPEKMVLDGGLTQYVKSQFKFTGRLRDEIMTVLINERNRLEEELKEL